MVSKIPPDTPEFVLILIQLVGRRTADLLCNSFFICVGAILCFDYFCQPIDYWIYLISIGIILRPPGSKRLCVNSIYIKVLDIQVTLKQYNYCISPKLIVLCKFITSPSTNPNFTVNIKLQLIKGSR